MIDKHFAKLFIDRLRKSMDERFTVFNTEGIILAATEEEREGVFHEAAYKMITEGHDVMLVYPSDVSNYLGVKQGVDMPILHGNKIMGGVGITGFPDRVMPLITMAKITIETMLEQEVYRKHLSVQNDEREEFFSLLMNSSPAVVSRMERIAEKMSLDSMLPRVAILYEINDPSVNRKEVMRQISDSTLFESQDFIHSTHNNEIIIFKSIKQPIERFFYEYKDEVINFVNYINVKLIERNVSFEYYIGSMQNRLIEYKYSFNHCIYLRDHKMPRTYFYDQMNDYIQDQVPLLELNGIFNSISNQMSNTQIAEFVETISALSASNYNLVEASKKLHVHKNTLIFRLDKIKNLFNINPVKSSIDRSFAYNLNIYLLKMYGSKLDDIIL